MMVGHNKGSIHVSLLIPQGSTGVELGVWKAGSSKLFREAVGDKGRLHLVDSWSVEPYRDDPDEHGSYDDYLDRYEKIVGSRDPKKFAQFYDQVHNEVMEWSQRFDNVHVHRMSTDEYFDCIENPVDWFYVDASHSYGQVLQDLQNCRAHLGQGGMIFGDDYGNKPGVVQAVDEFVKMAGLTLQEFPKNQYLIEL